MSNLKTKVELAISKRDDLTPDEKLEMLKISKNFSDELLEQAYKDYLKLLRRSKYENDRQR